MRPATRAIHEGGEPDAETGAVMPPIYMTSTFVRNGHGYEYTRAGNPNFTRLEKLLASLENAAHATVFSAGLGALTAMISMLEPGDKVIALDGVYGGTYRLFTRVFKKYGIEFKTFRPSSIADLESELAEKPKWLFFETPTNPLLEVFDIEAYANLAHAYNVKVVVDNTFATPYFQNPFDYGADIVWHSTTKYLGGHSDTIGGVVMTNDPEYKEQLDFARMSIGLNPSPFDVWLTTRGVKTLAVRMEQHQKNALALASFLEKHPKVKHVYYPGLESHPQHAIAAKQMRGFSGMVSVDFDLDFEPLKRMISSFSLITLAESLGGVESLVCHPATMTHASIPPEERKRIGISDGLVRFSVGIEDSEDLIEDVKRQL